MERRRRANPRRTSAKVEPETAAIDLVVLRREIVDVVAAHALAMVDTAIRQASEGNYGAMKYLFEMAGLYPPTAGAVERRDDSLVQTLLSRLGLSDSPTSGTEAHS